MDESSVNSALEPTNSLSDCRGASPENLAEAFQMIVLVVPNSCKAEDDTTSVC
jgi:hypothetical protein